jgi:hypothetical protein
VGGYARGGIGYGAGFGFRGGYPYGGFYGPRWGFGLGVSWWPGAYYGYAGCDPYYGYGCGYYAPYYQPAYPPVDYSVDPYGEYPEPAPYVAEGVGVGAVVAVHRFANDGHWHRFGER